MIVRYWPAGASCRQPIVPGIGLPPWSVAVAENVTVSPKPALMVSGVTAIWASRWFTVIASVSRTGTSGSPTVCCTMNVVDPFACAVMSTNSLIGPYVESETVGPGTVFVQENWYAGFGGSGAPPESTSWATNVRRHSTL